MISQEAFDEMVDENMEDFEMTKEDALAETIKQLTSMGRDLSSIDTTGGQERERIIAAVGILKKYREVEASEVICAVKSLELLCNDKYEFGKRNQNILRVTGGIGHVIAAIDASLDMETVLLILELLSNVCRNNVDNRDMFQPNGSQKLCDILNHCFDNLSEEADEPQQFALLKSCFRLSKVMAKSESNKVGLMQDGINLLIKRAIALDKASFFDSRKFPSEMVLEACLTLRGLCIHDDQRKEMSCAYENGKRFLADGCVPLLMTLAADFEQEPDLAAAALSAVRQLVLSVEAVKIVAGQGLLDLPKRIYQYPGSSLALMRSVTGFMRNLCADDARKNSFVSDGTLALLVEAMTQESVQSDAVFMEHAFACLAAMSLRYPSNAIRIVELGAVQEIVNGMRKHEDKPSLQRQGCLAIRNIAARSPELRARILDSGVEDVLRLAGRMQEAVDEAYGALRDLDCEVQYVKINETGEIEAAHAQFGGQRPKFNPVFDETYDIEQRVESEAKAPFDSQGKSIFRNDIDQDEKDLEMIHDDSHVHSENCSH